MKIISVLQLILGFLLIGLILLQSKGTGLGSTFGGGMEFYGTKRGAEKMIFVFTIVIAILFFISLIVGIVVDV